LLDHNWPGNIRELQNVVERAVILCGDSGMVENEHLGLAINSTSANTANGSQPSSVVLNGDGELCTLPELEKRQILAALERCNGNRTHAAKMLAVSIRTLRNKLHEYNGTSPKAEEETETA
jgi:DNA-binding NtrC family response regulator